LCLIVVTLFQATALALDERSVEASPSRYRAPLGVGSLFCSFTDRIATKISTAAPGAISDRNAS
jgi:hypothetical protein